MENTVNIHGSLWQLADIQESINLCRKKTWTARQWTPAPALVDRASGAVRIYYGQRYNPEYFDVVPYGWSHDHCAVCWWSWELTSC